MKIIVFGLLILFGSQSLLHSQSPVIQSIINQTNLDSLIYFVKELSGEVPTIISGAPYTILSRHVNQPSHNKAADYINQKLNSYGLATYDQWFSATGRNVYGVQLGSVYPNKKYIICAHYDDMPEGTIAPGADDNASGTAAVIEAARVLTQYESKYTIIYALWDEEEIGLGGSLYFAQQAATAGDSIMGVINVDMISWDSDNDAVGEIHTSPIANSINIKDIMVQVNTNYNIGVIPSIINPGVNASDQYAFWINGYGAILLIEEYYGGDFNAYYHTINDLLIHFNQPYYHKMSRLSLGTVATLAELTEIVPVELISFTANTNGREVILNWSTASELNNNGFEIQRRVLESNFATIGFVKGEGATTNQKEYSYTDNDLTDGKYFYRLKQIDFNGAYEYSNVIEVEVRSINEFVLQQNFPNPFNPITTIGYALKENSNVILTLLNVIGEQIAVMVNEEQDKGIHKVDFNASNLPSGIYFYRLQSGSFVQTRKMILLK
jgi:hypothetical protein